jgi:murein DD-endopeptidase MepM/ murein hydrolase activator NlpD
MSRWQTGLVTKTLVVGIVASQLLFIAETPVYAGIFSLVSSLFAQEATTSISGDVTSQKMPLLEAPTNANPKAANVVTVTSTTSVDLPNVTAKTATGTTDTTLSSPANPVAQSPTLAAAASTAPASNKISIYTVQTGDTISTIAEKNGISTNTVLWANGLKKTSTISVGKKLRILPITGIEYTVAKGDTLSSISAKYNGDIDEIMAFNNIDKGDPIKLGDIIVIPDGEISSVAASASTKIVTAAKTVASATLGVNVAKADTQAGYYMRPISGGIRTQGNHGDNAVDLADSCGSPIYASAAGDILVSEGTGSWDGGYGNYVVISHNNGSQTLYGHMKDVQVKEGQHVNQGQQIGTIGATGKVQGATGCHVHFEIRDGIRNPF